MPDERARRKLDDYLRGDSALSRQYRRENAPMPPHALDRIVLDSARQARTGSADPQRLAPLAFAASVLLSVAMIAAMLFVPQAKRPDDRAHIVRVRMFKSEAPRAALASPRERDPTLWLADINALRRAGRGAEAELQMRRFRSAYPDYIVPSNE
ncbi:MAG TPA: hypothetical protein VHW71_00885 [Steroidobacteraceae bacterium]|jgi:hypothetical protein|nr:hypothetical protein [Steroidobacteraceae bacterium]